MAFPDSPRNGAWGDRPYAIIDIAGPASYVQVTNGTPPTGPTGGQAIGPSNFGLVAGLEGIDLVGGSTSGTYIVTPFQSTVQNLYSNNQNWLLRWSVAATGAEVAAGTNLSAEYVRLIAFGPY
jgi:hypothetical protein